MPPATPPAVRAALRPLAAGYRELFGRVHSAAVADERIRALWLSGSLAKGTADVGSDLDLVLAVRDEDFVPFASDMRFWLETFIDPLVARPLPFADGCVTVLTADCLRLDVISEPVRALPFSGHRHRFPVFDRDGLDGAIPEPDPVPDRDPGRVADLIEEAYRRIAIFGQAVVGRADWLLGVAGVQGQRELLYELFVEVNRPLPPMGQKHYAARLSPAQRDVLCGLPAVVAERESLIAGMRATVRAWNLDGRAAAESIDVVWPVRLAEAVTEYFDRCC